MCKPLEDIRDLSDRCSTLFYSFGTTLLNSGLGSDWTEDLASQAQGPLVNASAYRV